MKNFIRQLFVKIRQWLQPRDFDLAQFEKLESKKFIPKGGPYGHN
ncbi:MAG TPA: hypothetical protein VF412_17000 [Bdellovibrio sp.]